MRAQAVLLILSVMGASLTWAGTATRVDSATAYCAKRIWSFDGDTVGSVPRGWRVAETAGTGTPATWEVVADDSAPSSPHAIALTQAANSGRTFNLLLATDTAYEDVEVEVMVKAAAGEEDQGGGPVWRALDADNYYVARWNPLEDNFRVYFVKNGRRRQLASATVEAASRAWHEIEVEHVGCRIRASLDDKEVIDVVDSTFTEAGMVGLWTKADAATVFDNLSVEKGDVEEDADE